MRLAILVTLAIALVFSFTNALLVPHMAMTDEEINNLLITDQNLSDSPGGM